MNKISCDKMIEKIEISMINETVHNFRKGEFGVRSIEIDEVRGFIDVEYSSQEGGVKKVLIPLGNVEKCEFLEKADITAEKSEK